MNNLKTPVFLALRFEIGLALNFQRQGVLSRLAFLCAE